MAPSQDLKKNMEDRVWWLEYDGANIVRSELGEMLNCSLNHQYIITILSSIITSGFWFTSLESDF